MLCIRKDCARLEHGNGSAGGRLYLYCRKAHLHPRPAGLDQAVQQASRSNAVKYLLPELSRQYPVVELIQSFAEHQFEFRSVLSFSEVSPQPRQENHQ